MAVYTIHLPGNRRDTEALEGAVVLRDGFSWAAFIFSGFWLLWHRLWLAFFGFVILSVALALLGTFGLPQPVMTALEILLALAIGFEGRNLRRAKLEKRGYHLAGVASAGNQERAERKIFAELRAGLRPASTVPLSPMPAAYGARHEGSNGVIGLFPSPGVNR